MADGRVADEFSKSIFLEVEALHGEILFHIPYSFFNEAWKEAKWEIFCQRQTDKGRVRHAFIFKE